MTVLMLVYHMITVFPFHRTLARFYGLLLRGASRPREEGKRWTGAGGREVELEGESVGKKGGVSVFFLSRHVNPKHNPCTCWIMLSCCPAMARE